MMLPQRVGRACHVLLLVLCLSAAEDFEWTTNNHDSFYYGTFPSGMIPPYEYFPLRPLEYELIYRDSIVYK